MPTLPRASNALTIRSFDRNLDHRAFTCDLGPLTFIDAYGLVGTACSLWLALAESPDLEIEIPSHGNTNTHLTAMGFRDFLSELGRSSLLPKAPAVDASDVVVPLRRAADSGGEQALSHLLWGQLRDHVAPQILEAIAEGVWEIVANALEHSGSEAAIMAQVYRADRGGRPPDHDNRVQVVIGDVGRGIRASFLDTGMREPKDDLEAINLALEYLVTSVPDDPGRGQGLTTTMEQVTGLGGQIIIRSGTGKITVESSGKATEEKVPSLQGAIVALNLPLYPG